MIKENKVFQKVNKSFLAADTPEHSLQFYAAGIIFFKTLPFVEKFIFAAESSDFSVMPVTQDEKSVVIKKLRNGILIIGIVIGIGILHIHVNSLEFHKQKRNTVYKAHNIRPAAVESALDFEFLDSKKMVIGRILKINEFGSAGGKFAIGKFDGNRDTVTDEEIFFLIDLHKGGRSKMIFEFLLSFIDLSRSDPGIKLFEFKTKISSEQNFVITFAPESSIWSENLGIVSKLDLPAQLILEQISRTFLHQNIFRIFVTHSFFSP